MKQLAESLGYFLNIIVCSCSLAQDFGYQDNKNLGLGHFVTGPFAHFGADVSMRGRFGTWHFGMWLLGLVNYQKKNFCLWPYHYSR